MTGNGSLSGGRLGQNFGLSSQETALATGYRTTVFKLMEEVGNAADSTSGQAIQFPTAPKRLLSLH